MTLDVYHGRKTTIQLLKNTTELENSGIRVAGGDCSVTERWRWRPPYQTGKTVHVHA